MTSYANIIAGPAAVLKPGITPRTFREPEEEEDSVFNYVETASDRVGNGILTERLIDERSLSSAAAPASTTWTSSPIRRSARFVSSTATSS